MLPKLKHWRQKYQRWIRSVWRWVVDQIYRDAIAFSLVVLLVSILVVSLLYPTITEWADEFWKGVLVEFTGMIFDIAVFGVVIAFFLRLTERRREIRHQQEIIDDFKKWNSEEARFRIAGAVRRINHLRKTDIDFGGIDLHDFSFRKNDIQSIRGSIFFDGTWGGMGSRDEVVLERVDLSFVDCRDVVFSPFNPFSGFFKSLVVLRDCKFVDANLSGATFNGANLEWTNTHPEKLGIWHEQPDGPPAFQQTHYPPFSEADLKGTSFADARFENADFREARNILECDFSGASGLETCLFDDDETKNAIMEQVSKEKRESGSNIKHKC